MRRQKHTILTIITLLMMTIIFAQNADLLSKKMKSSGKD